MSASDADVAARLRELGWVAVPVNSLNGTRLVWSAPNADKTFTTEEAAEAAGITEEADGE